MESDDEDDVYRHDSDSGDDFEPNNDDFDLDIDIGESRSRSCSRSSSPNYDDDELGPQTSGDRGRRGHGMGVGDSLSLLRFMNESDKNDIWTFWKTVSSAVKIAVNGKGDVVPVSKRSKSLEWHKMEPENECIDHLEKNTAAFNLPLKTSNNDVANYRVLKVINEAADFTDYEISVPLVSKTSNNDNETMEEHRDNFVSIDKSLKSEISHEEILQPVTSADIKNIDTQVNSVETSPSTSQENDQQQSSTTENVKRLHQRRRRTIIWPITRPATRSSSKNQSSQNVSNADPIVTKVCTSKQPPNGEQATTECQISDKNLDCKGENSANECDSVTPVVNDKEREGLEEVAHNLGDSEQERERNDNSHLSLTSSQESSICNRLLSNNVLQPHERQESSALHSVENSSNQTAFNSQFVENQVTYKEGQIMHIKIEEPAMGNESEIGLDVKPDSQVMDQEIQGHGDLANKSTSDIETIISALEAELKKNGNDVDTISISSAKEGSAKVMTASNDQVVHFIPGQEIVEIQNGQDVIWTSTGDVQVAGAQAMIEAVAVAEGTVLEEGSMVPHIDAQTQYDVVEYEVFADKEKVSVNGGMKKKKKNVCQEKDVLDRTCPMCHRILTYASSMAAHMRIHTGDRPYSCGQCDRKFTTKANRDRHEATHVGLKPFKCAECDKSFTEKRSLKIHNRTHTGERPFVCTICGQGFAQKCTLLVHMDRHTNKKGHLCDLCGKAFRQKCQLDIHVKRHNRQANYPCAQCSVKCYTRGDLMRHMIRHTGERPFECSLCSRTFTRKQYLMDHENTHYGRKPYKCSICSQAFHDMGSCHRHLRKHRQEEDENGGRKSQKITSLFSKEDFDIILKSSQTGQVLTLEDGTKALIKAVESEADGSIVYHISCVGNDFVPDSSVCNETESADLPPLDKAVSDSSEAPSVSKT